MVKKIAAIIIGIISLSVIAMAVSQLTVSPDTVQDIDVGAIGHYTLTLTTSTDPIGGSLHWHADDAKIWAGIDAAPTGQTGDEPITTSSTCSAGVCTQTFDLQVQPQSGITLNVVHDITVDYLNDHGVAKAMVTASGNPVPEVSTGLLVTTGLIGLVGLVRYKRK